MFTVFDEHSYHQGRVVFDEHSYQGRVGCLLCLASSNTLGF